MINFLYRPYKNKDFLVPVKTEYFNGELLWGEVDDADPNTKCLILDPNTGLIVCSGESKQAAINKYYDVYKAKFENFKRTQVEQYNIYRAEYTALLIDFNLKLEAQKGVKNDSLD